MCGIGRACLLSDVDIVRVCACARVRVLVPERAGAAPAEDNGAVRVAGARQQVAAEPARPIAGHWHRPSFLAAGHPLCFHGEGCLWLEGWWELRCDCS